MLRGWLVRLRGLVAARQERRELEEELRYHLDAETERNMAAGMAEEEARTAARRAMGDLLVARERAREAYGWTWLDHLGQDLRSAVRGLLRDRGVSAFVIVTLALGLGATAAVFSLADQLFLRPPEGVVNPGGVRRLYMRTHFTQDQSPVIQPWVWCAEATAVDSAIAPRARTTEYVAPDTVLMGRAGASGYVNASYVSLGYFRFLGIRAAWGRFFAADENRMDRPEDAHVAVLSYALWQQRFGGDSTILGRVVELGHREFTIIGVAQRGFSGTDLDAADVWMPLASVPPPPAGGEWYRNWRAGGPRLVLLVRADTGTSDAWIAAVATAVYRRGEKANVDVEPDTTATALTGPILASLGPSLTPAPDVAITWRLIGVALIVLLVACANVANLLLLRGVKRRREIAVRSALGIPRGRLIRQLLAESVLLAAAGGVAALLMALWAGRVLRAMLLPTVHWASGGVLDHRLFVFGGALTLAVGVAAGVAPALRASRPDLTEALKSGARNGGGARSRLRTGLMLTQVSLSVLLLVGAGLFVRSLRNVRGIDLGYEMNRLAMGYVLWLTPDGAYDGAYAWKHSRAIGETMTQVAARLSRQPGVESAAAASYMPMRGYAMMRWFLEDGRAVPRLANYDPDAMSVAPGYFRTTGLKLLRGRTFDDGDRKGAPAVVIVDETAARLYWPGKDPLGQCLRPGLPTPSSCMTVVGVTEDAHLQNVIEAPRVEIYMPLAQFPMGAASVIARAAPGEIGTATAAIRRALREAFPDAEPPYVTTGADLIGGQYRPWETGTALFGVLGLLALLVAAVGVYSVVAYSVSQRTHEMGVRMALGARMREVAALVLGRSLVVLTAGVLMGVGLALALGRLVASLLYGVSAHDPLVMVTVALVLLAVGLLASVVPAWRAARVDPVKALGVE